MKKSTTFTTDIPKPKGWVPNKKKQPKKLFLFIVIGRFFKWYKNNDNVFAPTNKQLFWMILIITIACLMKVLQLYKL